MIHEWPMDNQSMAHKPKIAGFTRPRKYSDQEGCVRRSVVSLEHPSQAARHGKGRVNKQATRGAVGDAEMQELGVPLTWEGALEVSVLTLPLRRRLQVSGLRSGRLDGRTFLPTVFPGLTASAVVSPLGLE